MGDATGAEIPQEIREQYQHTPVYCTECEMPVSVTIKTNARPHDWPIRWECSCYTGRDDAFYDGWVVPDA